MDRSKHDKFIQDMLEKTKENKETKAQTRFDNVDEKEVEKNLKEIMEKIEKR